MSPIREMGIGLKQSRFSRRAKDYFSGDAA
jgi:hypothetical protein